MSTFLISFSRFVNEHFSAAQFGEAVPAELRALINVLNDEIFRDGFGN